MECETVFILTAIVIMVFIGDRWIVREINIAAVMDDSVKIF